VQRKVFPPCAVWSEVVYNETEKRLTDGVYLHASESAFQLVPVSTVDRKFGLLPLSERGSEGRQERVPAIVNSGLEVVYSVPNYERKIIERQGTLEIVMKKLAASLRIDFSRNTLSLWRTEISDLSIYIRDMFIGPFDLESC
jgi:hypothetical protein